MDLSSMLPLLMNSNGGGTDAGRLASVLSAMNGGAQGNTANILSAMSGANTKSNDDAAQQNNGNAALINMLLNKNGSGETNQNANLLNILSLANKNRNAQNKPSGLKPIKDIAPNDILGIMVKQLSK